MTANCWKYCNTFDLQLLQLPNIVSEISKPCQFSLFDSDFVDNIIGSFLCMSISSTVVVMLLPILRLLAVRMVIGKPDDFLLQIKAYTKIKKYKYAINVDFNGRYC